MINKTIQAIWYDGLYIFRGRTICSQIVFDKIQSDEIVYDIRKIYKEKLKTECGKRQMTILLNPENRLCSPEVYDMAFDYFIQYKEKY